MLVQIGPQKTFATSDPADMDRMVTRYFAAVAKTNFNYFSNTIAPKPLVVSPLIFRDLECPEMCGACCRNDGRGLTYLPAEAKPATATNITQITINETAFELLYDVQPSWNFCWNLDDKGRCKIYPLRPFACDLPPIQVTEYKTHNVLSGRKLGRGHALMKVDGTRGVTTILHPASDLSVADTIRKLWRLKQWVDYFELQTYVNEIITWANGYTPKIKELRLGF
jgi:Fe-S-cluster containining protein